MSLQNVGRVLLAAGLFAALFLLSGPGPRPAPGQEAVLEPWLAGEGELPAAAGDAPEAEVPHLRYWEPDSPGRIAREWGNLLAQARLAREQGVVGELLGEIEREAARVIEAAGKRGPALSHHAGERGPVSPRREAESPERSAISNFLEWSDRLPVRL